MKFKYKYEIYFTLSLCKPIPRGADFNLVL